MAVEELDVREEDDGSAVIVDPNEQLQQQEVKPQATPPEEDEHDDEQPSAQEATAQAEEEAAATTDEEREAIRQRRREERRQKKEHQKQLVSELRAEVEAERRQRMELAQRLAAVEQRNSSADLAAIDNAITQIDAAEVQLKNLLADAVTKQDGTTVADITDRLLTAKREKERLSNIKQTFSQRQSNRPPLAPELLNNAQRWMQRNNWYSPQGADLDSQIVRVIDQAIAAEGFDPRTPTYWDELQRRVEQRLPHRVRVTPQTQQQQTQQKPARTPVAGSGREGSSAQTTASNTYRLSADRVKALKDAGMWEDPKVRAEMINHYREFDKKNSARS